MAHEVAEGKKTDPWILLIDDDADFGRILAAYLKKLGVRLQVTSTVRDFADVVKNDQPALCLVDLNINGLVAGYSLIKGLRRKFGPALPMMIVSATTDLAAISHAIECGADDYITKPIDLQSLNAKIGRYIKLAKSVEEKSVFRDAPAGGLPVQVSFEAAVKSVDELSLTVISPHFVCKGAPAHFLGDLIDQAFPEKKKAMATVKSCELMQDGNYLIVLEFAELSAVDLACLRKFIAGFPGK